MSYYHPGPSTITPDLGTRSPDHALYCKFFQDSSSSAQARLDPDLDEISDIHVKSEMDPSEEHDWGQGGPKEAKTLKGEPSCHKFKASPIVSMGQLKKLQEEGSMYRFILPKHPSLDRGPSYSQTIPNNMRKQKHRNGGDAYKEYLSDRDEAIQDFRELEMSRLRDPSVVYAVSTMSTGPAYLPLDYWGTATPGTNHPASGDLWSSQWYDYDPSFPVNPHQDEEVKQESSIDYWSSVRSGYSPHLPS